MASQPTALLELDVTYTQTCSACREAGRPGVPIGFSFQRGIICQTGQHEFQSMPGEGETEQSKPASRPAAAKNLSGSGAFSSRVAAEPEKAAAKTEVAELPEPAPLPDGVVEKVQVSDLREVAGGDLAFTLKIPDRHAQAVKAEAEIQRQTVEEYLQDWISAALDNFWGR